MNAFLEKGSVCPIRNELLHLYEFVFMTSLETFRVVKDELVVAAEDQLVLNVVHSALRLFEHHSQACLVQAGVERDVPLWIPRPGRDQSNARLGIHSTYCIIIVTYLSPLTVIDLWVFRRVTDCAENCRLARVGPADDEDPEATEFLVEIS